MGYRDLLKKIPPFDKVWGLMEGVYEELDYIKSRHDVSDALFDEYQKFRCTDEYLSAFEDPEPLISICVATYNRGDLLVTRCLRSLLDQDYKNIEIIVVGDGCSDETERKMRAIKDSRVTFKNLPNRGAYPVEPKWRWMVAGTAAMNEALSMTRGSFITHLDDDDEHPHNRISSLLAFARKKRCDILWHPFYRELPGGKWVLRSSSNFSRNNVTTSSVFYHGWFRKVPWDINAYKYREPGDWNRFRKFKYLGAKAEFFPGPMLKHYREMSQPVVSGA